ncbi:MAG: hypothetical protein EPO52_14315 [Herbiconiux sp.]|uniref:hypothetical protein n=1 Tax=Herbiconiux sp. TaxID=1871186 RepID=UPI001201CF79|nr:hypothetical protein [Herbiconiux sp.]TAJ46724.1 MAG: hypothetical protein EPO52_14315 [Herbiconiux sp.]
MTSREEPALSYLAFCEDILWVAHADRDRVADRLGQPEIEYDVGDRVFASWGKLDVVFARGRIRSLTLAGGALRSHAALSAQAREWAAAVSGAEQLRRILDVAGERYLEIPSGSEESGDWTTFRVENGMEIDVSDAVLAVTWHRR